MAIKHAEQRIMQSVYDDIRAWVRGHAQDYILAHFTQLTERRKTAHAAHLDRITSHAYYHYQSPPHPNEMVAAQATLKRGIDQDWQASVQRYPEVLEYFFGLVELTLPGDAEPGVKDPPSNALTGGRKAGRRPTNIQAGHMYDADMALPPPRQGSTPPHAQMMVRRPISPHANVGRRTPGPVSNGALPPARMNRINYRGGAPPGPPPAQSYYQPY
ncbi:hypothetical protein HOO65_020138 [Ceratocystis lukuohia]|nr:hypothetical protein CFO_g4962 [Ceratocystis platani]